jgi:hypothetical protein
VDTRLKFIGHSAFQIMQNCRWSWPVPESCGART